MRKPFGNKNQSEQKKFFPKKEAVIEFFENQLPLFIFLFSALIVFIQLSQTFQSLQDAVEVIQPKISKQKDQSALQTTMMNEHRKKIELPDLVIDRLNNFFQK